MSFLARICFPNKSCGGWCQTNPRTDGDFHLYLLRICRSSASIRSSFRDLNTSGLLILCLGMTGCEMQSAQRVISDPSVVAAATVTFVLPVLPTSSTLFTPSASISPSVTYTSIGTSTHTLVPSIATSTDTVVPPTATKTLTSTLTATVQATYTATPSPMPTNIPPTPVPTPWPTPDSEASRRVAHVPILMYHYVEPLPEDADEIRVGLTVQPGIFRQQLAYLHARGYRSVSLYDLLYYLAHGKPLPEKPIIFTFDDGYRGLYKYAFPHMQAFGYSGTVFLVTGLMDERHPAYLTWDMALELFTNGWKLEPHSKTHVQLSDRPFPLVEYQVLGSMQTLQAHIDMQPRFFSYPSGRYDQQVIDYLLALGFWGAVTTEYGVEHDLDGALTWQRVRVPGRGSLSDLAKYLGENQ